MNASVLSCVCGRSGRLTQALGLVKRALAILVALLSAGWLFPIWLGAYTYLSFWQSEGWPLLRGEHPANSFPFLPSAITFFQVGFAWLAIVILFWSYLGFAHFVRGHKA